MRKISHGRYDTICKKILKKQKKPERNSWWLYWRCSVQTRFFHLIVTLDERFFLGGAFQKTFITNEAVIKNCRKIKRIIRRSGCGGRWDARCCNRRTPVKII